MLGSLLLTTHILHAQHSDPGKQAEHMALLDLLPSGDEDITAVQNGSWFNHSTWSGGVPSTGDTVRIPEGVSVTYNGVSNDRIKFIRLDGKLTFASNADSKLIVDTLITTPSSELAIGTSTSPIAANRSVNIVIAPVTPFNPGNPSATAIDTAWDWHQLSRGVVTHGKVRIHGAAKTAFHRVASDPAAGNTTITLENAPSGWKVGDTVTITGTMYVKDSFLGNGLWQWNGTEDEVREITAINGATIALDAPLDYDHPGEGIDITGDPMRAYVANNSRNIRIETENPNETPVQQRGHVMFMHNPNIDVRYAEFHELGRTDKSIPLDDHLLDQNNNRIVDGNGDLVPGARTNIRGRYACHVHRVGATDPTGTPAHIEGCAVWGSPGWGFVHHDSFADFIGNVSYDVFASHFVTETGNELGMWEGNIAIRSEAKSSPKPSGRQVNDHDIGQSGAGFWFQGRVTGNHNNVSAGHRVSGIVYQLRGDDNKPVVREGLEFPEITYGAPTIGSRHPEIHDFLNNEVIASDQGFHVVKTNVNQHHAARSMIRELTAWNVPSGTHNEYTARYSFVNATLVGAANNWKAKGGTGIDYGTSVADMIFIDSEIRRFSTGFYYKDNQLAWPAWLDDEEDVVFVDTEFIDCTNDLVHKNNNLAEIQIYTASQLPNNPLDFVLNVPAALNANDNFLISGHIYDTVGDLPFEEGLSSSQLESIAAENGYYQYDGMDVLPVDHPVMDRITGDATIFTILVDVTGAQFIYDAGIDMGPWETAIPQTLELDMRDGNAVVGSPAVVTIENISGSDVTLTGKFWMAANSGGATVDVAYDPNGGSNFSTVWASGIAIPNVGTGPYSQVAINLGSDLTIPAGTTLTIQVTRTAGQTVSKYFGSQSASDSNLNITTSVKRAIFGQIEYLKD